MRMGSDMLEHLLAPQTSFGAFSVVLTAALWFLSLWKIRRRGGVSFTLLVSGLFVWQLGKLFKNIPEWYLVDNAAQIWSQVSYFGANMLYPSFFSLAVLMSPRRVRNRRLYVGLAWAFAAFFVVSDALGWVSGPQQWSGTFYRGEPYALYYVFGAVFLFWFGWSLWLLRPVSVERVWRFRRESQAVFTASLIGTLSGLPEFLLIYLGYSIPLADLSPGLFAVVLYSAIYRFDYLGGKSFFQSVMLRMLWFVVLVLVSGFIWWTALHIDSMYEASWAWVLAVALILFVLTPYGLRVRRRLREKFTPVRANLSQALLYISRGLAKKDSPRAMMDDVIFELKEMLHFQSVQAVILPAEPGMKPEWTGDAPGQRNEGSTTDTSESPQMDVGFFDEQFNDEKCFDDALQLLKNYKDLQEPVSRRSLMLAMYEHSLDTAVIHRRYRMVRRLGCDVLVPVRGAGELQGWLLIQEDPHSRESWTTVSELLHAVAGILGQHLMMYHLLRRQARDQNIAELGMMSASLAHEIKNPLEGIYGSAQILQERAPAEDPFVEIILKDSRRLHDTLQNFLKLARPANPDLQPLNLQEWLQEFIQKQQALGVLIELIADEAGSTSGVAHFEHESTNTSANTSANTRTNGNSTNGKANEIRTNRSANFIPKSFVQADPVFVEQIMLNLVQNAWRYQQESDATKPVQVCLTSANHLKSSLGYLEIEVRDFGKGIAEANRDKIFTPFFTTSTQGNGLGLAISRKLSREMSGDLYFSEQSPGTSFFLRLSLTQRVTEKSATGGL